MLHSQANDLIKHNKARENFLISIIQYYCYNVMLAERIDKYNFINHKSRYKVTGHNNDQIKSLVW